MNRPQTTPRKARRRLALSLAIAAALGFAAGAQAGTSPSKLGPDGRARLLSAPASGDALDIALNYLGAHTSDLGLTAADLSTLALATRYHTDTLGTNLFFQQKLAGIPVFNAITSVHVLDSGAILTINNTAVGNVTSKLTSTMPLVTAAGAYQAALASLGKPNALAVPLRTLDLARQGVAFTGVGATQRPVPVQLMYVQQPDGSVRLAWEIYAKTKGNEVWYVHVDAANGAVLSKRNLVTELAKFRAYPFNSESPISTEVPVDLHQDLVSEFGDASLSPQGWVAGTTTTGNNVIAVEDRDNTDLDGYQPTGTGATGSKVFDFVHNDLRNPCEQPGALANVQSDAANLTPCDAYNPLNHNTNLEAAITNLFYWNNVMHDVMMLYGFTEGAGNFQTTNFTVEGTLRDVDAVYAQAQDGSGTNNANFFTPPDDGITPQLLPPAMQMYEWSPPGVVKVNLPAGFKDFDDGDNVLAAGTASFGPSLKSLTDAQRTGDVALGNDGSTGDGTGSVNDGCEALVGFPAGKIALVDRGLCEFGVKVVNAQNAGAKGVIIANSLGRETGDPMGPGAVGAQATIPSEMIGQSNGSRLKTALGQGVVNATLQIVPVPNRDSDLDAGVIAHEYGHGISNRLIGGPSSIACLINADYPDTANPGALIPIGEQMGEGWSDLYALIMTAQPTDTGNTARGVGAYVTFQKESGPGIRLYPYTRNMKVNPFTYGDVPAQVAPHGVGSVWATMVWDMYWRMVDLHGFEPNLRNSTSQAGNIRTLHYINDGIVITKCRPSFVDARNAIIAAAKVEHPEDECPIWQTFARRGLGLLALNPTAGEDHRQVLEDFTVPPTCASSTNLAPTAANDGYATRRNTKRTVAAPGVLANDADPDNQPIMAKLDKGPSHAKSFALKADGSFTYEPQAGYTGPDSFSYVAQDGQTSSNVATVAIDVTKK